MPTLTQAPIDLVAAHTNRLRCPDCHRFIGTVGAFDIVDEQCDVRYVLLPGGGYLRADR